MATFIRADRNRSLECFEDFIGIRWMAYFALSFDHRVIDGADAERFLAFVKDQLEAGDFSV